MPSGWSPHGSGTYCGNSVGTLDGHYKVKATACPGDTIIAQIASIRTGTANATNGLTIDGSTITGNVFGINIAQAYCRTTDDHRAVNTFEVTISDSKQLKNAMRRIEQIAGIVSVERVNT